MTKHFLTIVLMISLVSVLAGQGFTNTTKVQDLGDRQTITSIAIDDENNKFVGTDQALMKIGNDGIVETLVPNASVHALAWTKREGLWAAIDSNVLLHPESGERILLDGDKLRIRSMDFSGNQLWVGTNDGLYVVSVRREKITHRYGPENSKLLSADIRYVYVDESQIKWIGTDKGVARVVNDRWKVYEREARIMAITSNIEGVWIASDKEMWLVDAYNRWVPTAVADGLSSGQVRALAADKKGKLYILSDILVQFDPYNDQAVELENNYPSTGDAHVAILCDLDDNLWMGSLDNGLVTLKMEASENEAFDAFVSVLHPVCAGESSGGITINASGGTPPYTFIWGNDGISGRNPENLPAGRYMLTVTDATGVEFTHDISLEEPQPLTVSIEVVQDVSLQGKSDGILRVKTSGGTGDYSYAWSNGGSSRTISNADAGLHTISLSDRVGCMARAEYVMADGPAPVIVEEPEIEIGEVVIVGQKTDQPPVEAVAEEKEVTQPPVEVVVEEKPVVDKPKPKPVRPIESVDVEGLKTLDAGSLALGQTLRIEQLFFDADSTAIKNESHAVLDEVYSFLQSHERIAIEIGGHTNGLPEHEYCDRLSEARARNVAQYLYGKGIPTERISFKGYGKREPIATNETVMGRRQNQRVEIKILQI